MCENSKKKKKKKNNFFFFFFFEIGIFFSNWEKSHLNPIGRGAEFRPLRTPKKIPVFLHSARLLMLSDTCIKFSEYSLSGFQVMGRTRFCDGQRSKGNDFKSIKGRVTILALCTSSYAD